ncbi:DUF4931 domain-containing protein [bacterium]|nr:DUF4931 domain-containing protein [bacterium]
MKPSSELRFDIVSRDWVVIATGRAKRPETFKTRKKESLEEERECPFCHLETQGKIIYESKNVVVVPNLYPAFSKGESLNKRNVGPYQVMDGVGFHEVVITRDHNRQMAEFSVEEIKEVIDCYQSRYKELMTKPFVNYVSIFHNHKREAGASIAHPHSQIIAIPQYDPDIRKSLDGSKRYWKEYNRCPHCTMIEWDLKEKSRVIFENEKFVTLCPYVSRVGFEVRIYPKEHQAYFEKIDDEEKTLFSEAFQAGLKKLYKALNDPPYNFFLHTAPCDGQNYNHYHWHWEILPKTSTPAGFELGTGIEICTIEPEKAAEYLKRF